MAVDIDSLQIEIEATSSDAAAKIDALATALTNLKAAAKGGAGLTTVSKQMQALASAAASLNNTGIGKLRKIAPALNALSSVQKSSGLSSTVNALSKLSSVSESLKGNSIKEFASQMNQVASAMRPLATEMQKVSNGFSAFPIRIQKIIQSNTGLSASNNKAAKSFGVLGTGISSTTAKLGIYYLAFQRVANMASDWIKSANDYIENVNLFQVSMGEFYDEAFAYAELLNDRLGIDPSEWMRAQGVFMSMANGFGLARQQAYDLSEGLTELAYDLSSLYNEDVSESILRLQSALSGEIEPIRRLGISISQATLQEYTLNNETGRVSAKKGDPGFTRTNINLPVMVKIPEFYYKIERVGSIFRYYVADGPVDGLSLHPGSGDNYLGRYEAGEASSGTMGLILASYSGTTPSVSKTRSTFRDYARNMASGFQLRDIAAWCAYDLLYLVEYADWDGQKKIAQGLVNNPSVNKTGLTDAMVYHTGRANSSDNSAVQYRWIENPWGNVSEFIDGINVYRQSVYICTDPEIYTDDTDTNYPYSNIKLPTSGWIKGLGFSSVFPWAFIPNANGGSSISYIPDYTYSGPEWKVLNAGGHITSKQEAGLFFFHAGVTSSGTSNKVGARLQFREVKS